MMLLILTIRPLTQVQQTETQTWQFNSLKTPLKVVFSWSVP